MAKAESEKAVLEGDGLQILVTEDKGKEANNLRWELIDRDCWTRLIRACTYCKTIEDVVKHKAYCQGGYELI